MENIFDQFDAPPAQSNVFDQFDAHEQAMPVISSVDHGPIVPPPTGITGRTPAEEAAFQTARQKEQAAFDATRTPLTRAQDTATFIASAPVRALTQGEYGLGDVAGLANKQLGQNINAGEQAFAKANQTGLEYAKQAGDVLAGVPILSTMGAVPGEMLNTMGAATRQLPGEIGRVLREDAAAAKLPGAPAAGEAVAPAAAQPAATPHGIPDRAQTFAARDRLSNDLGVHIDLPEAVVGSKTNQSLGAGMKGMPIVGTPLDRANEKILSQMGQAKEAAGRKLGAVKGKELTGEALKKGAFDWIETTSKDYLKGLYDDVYNKVDASVTTPLTNAAKLAETLEDEMRASTGTAGKAAVDKISKALSRPEGLTVKGLSDLRSELGDMVTESKINKSPGARALDRMYGAVSEDLKSAVKNAGGDEALANWEKANKEARIVALKRKRLAEVVGTTEEKLGGDKVFDRALQYGAVKGGNARALRQLVGVVGEQSRGDFGAQVLNHMAVNVSTGLFSADRFLTEYGKMADGAKQLIFGDAKPHLDDIAKIARKYGEFSSGFNRSNTGKVNFILKFAKAVSNPTVLVGNIASPFVNPAAAATIAGQVGSIAGLRAKAWSLARPANAEKVATMVKSYDRVLRAVNAPAEVVAKHEQGLAASIRAYAQGVAEQTGLNADDVAAAAQKAADDARSGSE